MEDSKKKYTLHQEVLELKFGAERKAWGGKYHDDRALFCNVYDMMMEACEVMKGVDNVLIHVAFNKQCREEEDLLASISLHFKGRED